MPKIVQHKSRIFLLHFIQILNCNDTEVIQTNADAALSSRKSDTDKTTAVDTAADWLKTQLENQPPKPAKDLFKDAYEEGISRKSLLKAKDQLGVQSKKIGFHGGNVWSMENSLSMEVVG